MRGSRYLACSLPATDPSRFLDIRSPETASGSLRLGMHARENVPVVAEPDSASLSQVVGSPVGSPVAHGAFLPLNVEPLRSG